MSSILNLKDYDIVLTTSFEFKFGITGHLFEMIDYYYAIKQYTNLTPCILLADGTTKQELENAVSSKYDNLTIENIVEYVNPRVIIANHILITDGSHRLNQCDIIARNIYLFRCSETDFAPFARFKCNVFLLQDFEIYDERYAGFPITVIDYKKKILFEKYKQFNSPVSNVAMFYLTSLCRALTQEELDNSIAKHNCLDYIVITDNVSLYEGNNIYQIPVENLWDKFDTYIYTSIPRKQDCSSRFIIECLHYGKKVIYDIDYYDRALEIRKKDGLTGTVLNKDDYFLRLINEQTQR
jgi:hypothetical protein